MKKIIALILAAMLIFSCSGVVSAAQCSCDIAPVIYVGGFGTVLKYTDDEGNTHPVPEFDKEKLREMAPDIVMALIGATTEEAYPVLTCALSDMCDSVFGLIACDNNGDSINNVTSYPSGSVTYEAHKQTTYVSGDTGGSSCRYRFSYDWRLDPFYNAQLLKEYVEKVKTVTGHSKVTVACFSQGNSVVATYLHLYGSEDFEKLVMLSPALNGVSVVNSIYTGEVNFENYGSEVSALLDMFFVNDPSQELIASVVSVLTEYGVSDKLLGVFQNIVDSQFDKFLGEALFNNLGTMPGLWVFVKNEDFEKAKTNLFGNKQGYEKLIEKIDRYQNNIACRVEEIISSAKASGTDIVMAMGYGISSLPGDSEKKMHTDILVTTQSMSFGGIVAPFGETLGEDYTQKNTLCGHNHLSADGIIDASTCLFPEYTWFVKNQDHRTFEGGYGKLIDWAILFDGQPTVFSSETYPQFMENNGSGTLSVVDGVQEEDDTPAFIRFFKALIDFIIQWFQKLTAK